MKRQQLLSDYLRKKTRTEILNEDSSEHEHQTPRADEISTSKTAQIREKDSAAASQLEVHEDPSENLSNLTPGYGEISTLNAREEDREAALPDCWNMKQVEEFQKKYDGLTVRNKKLGCNHCAKFDFLYMKGIHVSKEWKGCNVEASGKNRVIQQASLRKKMSEHFSSKAHSLCEAQLKGRTDDMHNQPYFLERSLPLRVRKYMEENKKISVEIMTDYLIQNYQDFKNKKRKSFMKSVNKAYQWELDQRKSKNSAVETDDMDSNDIYELVREVTPDIVEVSVKKTPSIKKELDYSFSIDNLYKLSSAASNGFTDSRTSKGKQETPQKGKQETPQSSKNLKRKRNGQELDESETPPKSRKSIAKKIIPSITLADFPGKNSLPNAIFVLYKYLCGSRRKGLPNSALISGPKGSGKSRFIECLAGDLKIPLYRVSATLLNGGVGVDPGSLRTEVFAEALSSAPCILHIENVDELSSKEFGGGISKKSESRIIDQLKDLFKEISAMCMNKRVLLIAESRSQMIDPDLLSSLTLKFSLPVLNKEAKVALLKEFFAKVGTIAADVDFGEIAERATSFVAGDLKVLAQQSVIQAEYREAFEMTNMDFHAAKEQNYFADINQPEIEIKMEDILSALPTITPTLKQEGFPRPSNVKWEDVQGLQGVKEMINRKIIGPIKNKELYKKYGIDKPNGMLLYGPPGCGKTLLAEAVANAVGINLLSVKGPELLQMYQGESERKVREVFRRAESVAPCIIFFDEFDCLCPKRTGNADNGSRHSIVDALLVEMDGFGEKRDIYVIAATNRPETIDPAVLRPGRIGTMLYIDLPDIDGRIDIFQASAKKKKVLIDSDVNFREIASWCEYFSGADCTDVFKGASEEALIEAYPAYKEGKLKDEDAKIFKRHFETAFSIARQSVSTEARKEYLNMKARFESSLKRK